MEAKSIKKNLFIYSLKILVTSIFPIVIFPYASRTLGVEEIGKVEYSYSIACYFQLFSVLGISSYGIREGSGLRCDTLKLSRFIKEIFTINIISSTISLAAYILLINSSDFFSVYQEYLYVFIWYVLIGGWITDWVANIFEDFTYITIRAILLQIVAVLITYIGIKTPKDGMLYAFILVMPIIFSNLFNMLYVKRKLERACGQEKTGKLNYTRHIKGILYLFVILLAGNIYSLLDTTIIGLLAGNVEVGLYTVAAKYTRLIVQFLSALSTVFLARLSYYISVNDTQSFEDLFHKATKMILWIAIPCAVGMATMSNEIITIFSGNEFIMADNTMKVLAVNIIFSAIDGFLGWHILVPVHKEKYLLYATALGAMSNIILNVLFIPYWGVEGAAVATLISELEVFIICFSICKKMVPMTEIYISILKYIAAAIPIVIIYNCMKMIHMNYVLLIGVTIVLSALSYIVMLIGLRENFTIYNIKNIISLFIKRGNEC